jgi:hypothetical protein
VTFRRFSVAASSESAALSRRDFLKLRVSADRRVLELSCDSRYMHYQDARSGAARRQVSNHDDATQPRESRRGFDTPKPSELFAELEQRLAEADELRVLECDWLDGGDFGREVRARIEAFRRRGGHIELGRLPEAAPAKSRGPTS